MPRVLLLPALLLAAAGCTPLQWVKAHADPAQLAQDMALCQQEAWREASWRSWFYRPLGPTWMQDLQGRRLLVFPYTPFNDPFGERFFEESRLTHFCMRAKGYELVPAQPTK